MNQRLPYRAYLLWQIAALGLDEKAVAEYYQSNSFPYPFENSLDFDRAEVDARQSLLIPNGGRRRISRRHHNADDQALLEQMGYGDCYMALVAPDARDAAQGQAWIEIQELIANPVVRVAVECAIILKTPGKEVPDLLQLAFRQTLGEPAYELYKRLFFDVKGFTKDDWKRYLALCANDTFTYTRYFAALTKPKDEVFYMLNLPTEKQYSDFLKNVLLTADHKFRYWARLDSPCAGKEARDWADVGMIAGEKFTKYAKKDIKNFADAVQTSFEYVDNDIPMATAEMLSEAKPIEQAESKTEPADKLAPGALLPDPENF